jgi:hypothetical protein
VEYGRRTTTVPTILSCQDYLSGFHGDPEKPGCNRNSEASGFAITMAATLMIHDENTSGQKTNSFTLECLTEHMTVRELIRARIYQEVQDYNLREPEYFHGLVQPNEAERVLNGYKLRGKQKIDWQEQYQRALESFERNGFFVLVGDRQAEKLDEEFQVKVDTEVSFVKLLPLVGG